ncbi:hypothetical protein PMI36_04771 [Pseudomonas sp. GM79]|nr:hypothetical protein PMI36_04771 [Pseudomonas sp. GM79]
MNLQSLVELDDSFGICVVQEIAFASKPAPTVDLRCSHILCSPQIPCGSGLAREGSLQPYNNPANALANRLPRAPAAKSITV